MEVAAEILKCPVALPIKPEMHGRARVRSCDDGKISTGRLTWAPSWWVTLEFEQWQWGGATEEPEENEFEGGLLVSATSRGLCGLRGCRVPIQYTTGTCHIA